MNQDEKLLRRFSLFLIVSCALTFGVFYTMRAIGIVFDPQAWSVFLNAKLPLIWTQTTTALGTIVAIDLLTPGGTIPTIMNLRGTNDTPENRRTACYFLLGIGAVVAYTVKGGF